MIIRLFVAMLFAMTISSYARAAYEPGTMGYLYADCAAALENSKTPKEFLNTYCGGFVEGYGMGVLVSNNLPLGEPNEKDPCYAEKKKEYKRIEARLCKNLPDYRSMETPPGVVFRTVAETVFRWQEQMKTSKNMAVFKKPVEQEINNIITPGKFCDSLAKSYAPQNEPFKINPGLLEANWYAFVKSAPVTLAEKYEECKTDLKKGSFARTHCGAGIEGFLSGLYSTAHLQNRQSGAGGCAKEIDRFYQSLDMPGKMCVNKSTKPEEVGRAFLSRVESMKKQGQSLKISGFGGAGYQSVYFGFMCQR